MITLEAHGRTVHMDFEDPTDLIAARVLEGQRFYERDLLEDVWTRTRGTTGVAVDVGAHVGNHTLWFACVCGLHVVAIEPNPAACRQLEANLARNAPTSVVVIEAAAGRIAGRGRLVGGQPGNTGTVRVQAASEGDVPIVALDDLVYPGPVRIIKIDVEGSEADVLSGARHTIQEHRPVVYVEAPTETSRDGVAEAMADLGYQPFGRFCSTPTYGFEISP